MTCGKCTDGWIGVTTRSGVDAVKPCPTCRPPKPPESGTPISQEDAMEAALTITGVLSFAPKDAYSQTALAKFIFEKLCRFREQAQWLARRTPELHATWDTCGFEGLRQIFCSRYERPKDGVISISTPTYPDGIPPERPQPSPATIALPPAQVTADQILNRNVSAVAARLPTTTAGQELTPAELRREQEFNRILEDAITHQPDREPEPPPIAPRPRRLSEIVRLHPDDEPHDEPRPAGSFKPITAADIAAELEKAKEARK